MAWLDSPFFAALNAAWAALNAALASFAASASPAVTAACKAAAARASFPSAAAVSLRAMSFAHRGLAVVGPPVAVPHRSQRFQAGTYRSLLLNTCTSR